MTSDSNTCVQCGKPRRAQMQGSFTQWILDQGSCSCDLEAARPASAPKTEFCKVCRLAIGSGRDGSLTQWIFRSVTCSCAKPEVMQLAPQLTAEFEVSDDETELDVDANNFPAERYKPLKVLGTGASGTVYLSRDRLLKKLVAVKTLRRLTTEQLISFQTEARATSNLTHPGILKLLDFGPTVCGAPYMVLEPFDGINLDEYMKKTGPLKLPVFIDIFAQVVSALSAAHAVNVFHRDIKPSNILIGHNVETASSEEHLLRVKLIDFGVALVNKDETELVSKGQPLVGTPAYMAPDQARGIKYDARSEIYSLGCVFFKSLTGRLPFVGDTALETINMHNDSMPPSLSKAGQAEYAEELEELVSKCLEKDPDDRFSSMNDLSNAIERLKEQFLEPLQEPESEEHLEEPAPAAHSKSNQKVIAAFLVLFSVVIAVSAGVVIISVFSQPESKTTSATSKKEAKKEFIDMEILDTEEKMLKDSARTDPKAQLELANRYIIGQPGFKKNPAEAFKWCKLSAEGGNVDAQAFLGRMYQTGLGVDRDYLEATRWFEIAAKKGNANAQFELGNLIFTGDGEDKAEALDWYLKAAQQGHLEAQKHVGDMYMTGNGVKRNFKEAMLWYRKCAVQGDPVAKSNIGYLYHRGFGVSQDNAEAVRWFRQSANQGYSGAQYQLGYLLERGLGTPKDYKEAMQWYLKASFQGDIEASNCVGYLFERGLGVKTNYLEARRWYLKGATRNDPDSLRLLGRLYEKGHGVKQDYKTAMSWYLKAAERGNLDAAKSIGTFYRDGLGVDKDQDEANKWLKKAAQRPSVEEQEIKLVPISR